MVDVIGLAKKYLDIYFLTNIFTKMKVALCFIISYKHILNKEQIWKDWIEPNKDIINVYFHYKDYRAISSPWIHKHCIPQSRTMPTTYYHVVPGYIAVMSYAFYNDLDNKWFCFLTESCVPIISPQQFRSLFLNYFYSSIFTWKPAYWNIDIHTRANLRHLSSEYHLANGPWFTLSRSHVHKCILFMIKKNDIYQKVCKGGLANESIFAIILQTFGELKDHKKTINSCSTITDWSRMSNATSPHLFDENNKENSDFILAELKKNRYAMFLRKVSPSFPDEELIRIIYHTPKYHDFYWLYPLMYSKYLNCTKGKNIFLYGSYLIFLISAACFVSAFFNISHFF